MVRMYLLACLNRFAYVFVCVEERLEGRRGKEETEGEERQEGR